MSMSESLAFFGIIAVGTALIRFLPFLIFPENRDTPGYVLYLGKVLPYTIIGMLVVYCLRYIEFFRYPFGLPEGISICAILILQKWRNNMLLSIGGGTVIYMLLVQVVFA